MRYYLAYGSNLDEEQMRARCPEAILVGEAEIPGYRLLFKGSKTGSYLTIEKARGRKVPAGVWAVSDEDERHLDIYEGYPHFYYKKTFLVDVKHGEARTAVHAFAYIMRENRMPGIPDERYIDTCLRGYEDFGFDRTYLALAIADTVAMIEQQGKGTEWENSTKAST